MKTIIGVMGPGDQATPAETKTAYTLGEAIAQQGWVLLTGGRAAGVMEAASRGAKAAQGLTIGILPADHTGGMSTAVDIPIVTGLGNARNVINILSSHVVVVCGTGVGTASEVALAIKLGKPLVFMETRSADLSFWQGLGQSPIRHAKSVEQAIDFVQALLP
jgi:hypothetical protein